MAGSHRDQLSGGVRDPSARLPFLNAAEGMRESM
jgi:hypothetical protein